MKIVLDVMGGDNQPAEIIRGGAKFAKEFRQEIIFIGQQHLIRDELRRHDFFKHSIYHTSEVIAMEDSPLEAIRSKKHSSLVRGIELVKKGLAQAFVSPGNTGAVMAASLLYLKRIETIERPGIALVLPTIVAGKKVIIIDVGANVDCSPANLVQFALMGQIYAKEVLHIANPSLGLLNIGHEEGKGNELAKETYQLLKKNNVNFLGNMESGDIFRGKADVVVCDGFTGNMVLKTAEHAAKFVKDLIKKNTNNPRAFLGTWLLGPTFSKIKAIINPAQYGGAPLLGIKGVVIIAHGNSNAEAISNALRVAQNSYEVDLPGKIEENFKNLTVY